MIRGPLAFWRILFVVHLMGCIACSVWYLSQVGQVGTLHTVRALFWLGAPWSAASFYLDDIDSLATSILAFAPLMNLALIARRGWRSEAFATRLRREYAHLQPIHELRRVWWLLVVPAFGFLFLFWSYGYFTAESRLSGLAIAQLITLVNCAGLFLRDPSIQTLTLWALVSMPAGAAVAKFVALPKYLPPWLWLGLLLSFIAFAYVWRRRKNPR